MKLCFKSRAAALLMTAALACLSPTVALAQSGSGAEEYTGSIQVSAEKLQLMFADYAASFDQGKDPFAALEKEYPANKVSPLRTIPAEGISKLLLEASYIGWQLSRPKPERLSWSLWG